MSLLWKRNGGMIMIVYTTEHCPQCSFLKQELNKRKISFEVCTDDNILNQKNITFVPVVELSNGKQYSFSQALAALRAGELHD